jgi:hypothetical protein
VSQNAFALLRLIPISDHDKDAEILVLRHQITVLQRQLAPDTIRFAAADRAFLAALLHQLPRPALHSQRPLVHPDTTLRWHRDLLAHRHAARSQPKHPGQPPTVRSIRTLVLRLASQNPHWGYRRIHGELLVLGITLAASTVWEILTQAGIDPAPERAASTWADFLRSQAHALLARDFSAGTATGHLSDDTIVGVPTHDADYERGRELAQNTPLESWGFSKLRTLPTPSPTP